MFVHKCYECGKILVVGHDLISHVSISCIDEFQHNFFSKDNNKYATFCGDHFGEAKQLFESLAIPKKGE